MFHVAIEISEEHIQIAPLKPLYPSLLSFQFFKNAHIQSNYSAFSIT